MLENERRVLITEIESLDINTIPSQFRTRVILIRNLLVANIISAIILSSVAYQTDPGLYPKFRKLMIDFLENPIVFSLRFPNILYEEPYDGLSEIILQRMDAP